MASVSLKHIYKKYPGGVTAVSDFNLEIKDKEFLVLVGPSGCGKTTLLNIIGGLDHYTDGDLVIGGRSTKEYGDRDWDVYRNHRVGFIFQSYNLIPHQSVLNNVELALTLSGVSKGERRRRAKAALEQVGLGHRLDNFPAQLSGGEQQRVAIARALVNNPDVIIADEPTGNLDPSRSLELMLLLEKINSLGTTVLVVTHEQELVRRFDKRVIAIDDGLVVSDGLEEEEEELPELEEPPLSTDSILLIVVLPAIPSAVRP